MQKHLSRWPVPLPSAQPQRVWASRPRPLWWPLFDSLCEVQTLFASAVAAKAVNQSVDSICRDTTYTLIISPNLRNGTLILSLQAFITTYRSSSSVFMTNKTPRVAKTRRESTTPHHVATRHSQNGQIIVFLFFFLLRSTLPHDGFRTKQQHFQPSSAMTHHFFSLPPSQKSSPGCPLNNYFVTPFSRLYACALNDHLATIRSKLLLKIAELEVPCAVVKVFIGLFQIHLMSVPPPPPLTDDQLVTNPFTTGNFRIIPLDRNNAAR